MSTIFSRSSSPAPDRGRWLRMAALAVLVVTGGPARLLAAGCSDLVLVGQDGWKSVPVAKSRCNGVWSVENHLNWSSNNDWSPGPAGFQATAATARFTLGGDFDGDGFSDIAVIGKEVWVAFSRMDGTFRYWKIDDTNFLAWANAPGVQAVTGHFLPEPGMSEPGTQIALVGGPGWGSVPILAKYNFGFFRVLNLPAPSSASATLPDFSHWASGFGAQAFAMDINNDGYDDIALVGGSGWGSIPVAVSNGAGTFTPHNISGYGAWDLGWLSSGWSAGEFAGWAATPGITRLQGRFYDTTPGIALVGGSGWASVPVAHASFTNNNDGSLSPYGGFWVFNHAASDFATWSTQARFKLAGDFDGNGTTDIALVGGAGWGTVPVALSQYPWEPFRIENVFATWNPNQFSIADFASWATLSGVRAVAGDFDGNGKADIALVGGTGWASVPIAFSKGDGSFYVKNVATPSDDIGFPISQFAHWAQTSSAKPIVGEFVRTDSTLGRTEPYLGSPKVTIQTPWMGHTPYRCQSPCTLTFVALPTDFEDNQLRYEWGAAPDGLSPDGGCARGGMSSATCTITVSGYVSVSVRVTDAHGHVGAKSAVGQLEVTAPPVGPPPPPDPPRTIVPGGPCGMYDFCSWRVTDGQPVGPMYCARELPPEDPAANTCQACGRSGEKCCLYFVTDQLPDCVSGGAAGCDADTGRCR